MNDDETLLRKRFSELSERADNKGIYFFTNFLALNEQSSLLQMKTRLGSFGLFGGFPGAERRIACFGNEGSVGYPPSYPVVCVRIAPRSEKYSEELTHRDYLGALMSLGITREKLGDIVADGKSAYLFCIDSIAGYICDTLSEVRHTYVDCTILGELPEILVQEPPKTAVNVASERIDAVIAAVYRLSRNEAQKLIAQKLVFVNSVECDSGSGQLSEGDMVTVRHRGRFRFCGMEKTTKKGRLMCGIQKYT